MPDMHSLWPWQKFKLGVPIRDMRLMDPNLLTSETGKILVRDNAIVFSVEHVRVIITADMVIIPRDAFDHNPSNLRFNSLLQEHIIEAAQVSSCCWPRLPSAPSGCAAQPASASTSKISGCQLPACGSTMQHLCVALQTLQTQPVLL